MKRAERRAQILDTATTAFVRHAGFHVTSLDDVATAAGISRMILYRHFESKTDIFQAAIDRAIQDLFAASTNDDGELHDNSVPGIVEWAASQPDTFRLLFRYAVREPSHTAQIDQLRDSMAAHLMPHLDASAPPQWRQWAAIMATVTVVEGILAWLDAGSPDPAQASDRILRATAGALAAAGNLRDPEIPTSAVDWIMRGTIILVA